MIFQVRSSVIQKELRAEPTTISVHTTTHRKEAYEFIQATDHSSFKPPRGVFLGMSCQEKAPGENQNTQERWLAWEQLTPE